MKDWDNCDEIYEDGVDDEIDEEDTRERYPFLFADEDSDADVVGADRYGNVPDNEIKPNEAVKEGDKLTGSSPEPPAEASEEVLDETGHAERVAGPASRFLVRNSFDRDFLSGPNYHYLHKLTDKLLPQLDFYRYDNFFSARPAHGFFIDSELSPERLPCLFGEYWLAGEIAVLFADTGAGKSILATQIAQSIASGVSIKPFAMNVPAQRVAYFDLELSREQFDRRYSNSDAERPAKFPFHRNLIRNQPHPFVHMTEEFSDETDFIVRSMIAFIEFSQAKIVIIDNITWLNNASQIGNAAQRVMKGLSRIKREFELSILVLAHTPKRRVRLPLTINDLQGSKMIANFADSIFGIGSSRRGPEIRYLKSVKRRSTKPFDDRVVSTFKIEKDVCFLGMTYLGDHDERHHVGWVTSGMEPEKLAIMEKLMEMKETTMTQREMAKELNISVSTVNRYLRAIED